MMAKVDQERAVRLGLQWREATVSAVDRENRTVDLTFSSEEPVDRWWGIEVLRHTPDAVRLERINTLGPALLHHEFREQVGAVREGTAKLGKDKRNHAVVKVSRKQSGEDLLNDLEDRIMGNVSVGYRIHRLVLVEEVDEGLDRYEAVDWEPYEVSFVGPAADLTVGVGRGALTEEEEHSGAQRTWSVPVECTRADAGDAADVQVETEEVEEEPEAGERGEATSPELPPDTDRAQAAHEEQGMAKGTEAAAAEARGGEGAGTATAGVDQGVQTERKRVNTILGLGRKHDQTELAEKFVDDGSTVEAFKDALLDARGNAEEDKPVRSVEAAREQATIGMTEKDIKRWSLRKLILDAEKGRTDTFEMECSRAAADAVGVDLRGVGVPWDVLGSRHWLPPRWSNRHNGRPADALMRVLTSAVGSGADWIATDHLAGSFIDALYETVVLGSLGAIVMDGLVGDVAIPRLDAGVAGEWITGDGGDATEDSTVDPGQATMSPLTATSYAKISRKLLRQSTPAADWILRRDMTRRISVLVDRAGIQGSGSGEPTGILNTSGIGDVNGGGNGTAPDWGDICDLEQEVAVDNAETGRLAYLTNPKCRGKLKQTEKVNLSGRFVWDSDPVDAPMNGYPTAVTTSVPSNLEQGASGTTLSAILYGNFEDVIIGLWGILDILVDPYSDATAGTTALHVYQDADVTVRHVESFAAKQDCVTT